MAVPISAAVKTALDNAETQNCSLTVLKTGQARLLLTNANVIGMQLERASTSNGQIGIGNVIASTLTIQIDNHLGTYDNYDFEGAEISASVEVVGERISIGEFWVYEQPAVDKDIIEIVAYDSMFKMDAIVTEAQWSQVTFPITVDAFLTWICNKCGVTRASTVGFTNRLYNIVARPKTKKVTFRQLLAWCGEILGCNPYFNQLDVLNWGRYNINSPVLTLSESNRYTSNVAGKNIAITGIRIIDVNELEHISGGLTYAFTIEGNDLISEDVDECDALATNIGSAWNGFSYRPTSCETVPYPQLFPYDVLTYTYKNHSGTTITTKTIVSRIRYELNGRTTLEGIGETTSTYSSNNYGSYISSDGVKVNMISIPGFKIRDGEISCGKNGNLPFSIKVNDYETIPSVKFQVGSPATSPYIIFQETGTQGIYEAKIHNLKIYRTKDSTWITLEAWLDDIDNMLYN